MTTRTRRHVSTYTHTGRMLALILVVGLALIIAAGVIGHG